MYQLVNGDVTVSSMQKVELEGLLGKDAIKVNMDEIFGKSIPYDLDEFLKNL